MAQGTDNHTRHRHIATWLGGELSFAWLRVYSSDSVFSLGHFYCYWRPVAFTLCLLVRCIALCCERARAHAHAQNLPTWWRFLLVFFSFIFLYMLPSVQFVVGCWLLATIFLMLLFKLPIFFVVLLGKRANFNCLAFYLLQFFSVCFFATYYLPLVAVLFNPLLLTMWAAVGLPRIVRSLRLNIGRIGLFCSCSSLNAQNAIGYLLFWPFSKKLYGCGRL